jgi:hypothetical protein
MNLFWLVDIGVLAFCAVAGALAVRRINRMRQP